MFEELERLRESVALCQLLAEYVERGSADAEAWLDRRMHLEGVQAKELVQLHGELIAYGWIEQNTGIIAVLKPGGAAGCYRATAAGRRALQLARSGWEPDQDEAVAA